MDGEIRFKEIPRKKKKRTKKHYFMRLLVIVGLLVIAGMVLMSPVFDVEKILVEGNHYYTDEQVINMSGAQTGQNIFLHTGASEIRENLLQNPYFSRVEVNRKFPSELVIRLKERPEVAALKYADHYVIIDEEGRVLRITPYKPKLTFLTGLRLSKIETGEKVETVEAEALITTLDMVHAMDKGDLFFKRIEMDDQFISAYIYDTLIVRGRPENIKKSIKKGDLQKVINKLYKGKAKRGTVTVGDDNYLSFSPAI